MISLSFTRRIMNWFGATFVLVFAWKLILLVFTAQPVPANDAFGYDGAVVNYLLNGHYCNPSLIIPFPFSATKIYCAYPPVYQGLLYLWMSVFGTSPLAAMWLHLAMFGAYLLVLLAIFRRLNVPAWAVNVAGLFLFGITFDDRPDGLAQLLGIVAVFAWVRTASQAKPGAWPWLATLTVVLAIGTDPEIGGLYLGWMWLLALGAAVLLQKRFPLPAMLAMIVVPVGLMLAVKYGRPDLWAGFMEHAAQTPSFTGLRIPHGADLLKLVRTIPAILVIAGLMVWTLRSGGLKYHFDSDDVESSAAILLVSGVLISIGLVAAGLSLFTSNWILILAHFQPLLVGMFLCLTVKGALPAIPRQGPVLVVLVLLVSVRAIGMTTWGVACAVDVDSARGREIARAELEKLPAGSTVVMSTPFLYDAMKFPGIRTIHEDWTHRAGEVPQALNGDTLALLRLKPAALILSEFDFHRRYRIPLAELAAMPDKVALHVVDAAHFPPPDAFPSFQQVVQNVSWAPVIVEFTWK